VVNSRIEAARTWDLAGCDCSGRSSGDLFRGLLSGCRRRLAVRGLVDSIPQSPQIPDFRELSGSGQGVSEPGASVRTPLEVRHGAKDRVSQFMGETVCSAPGLACGDARKGRKFV